MKRRDELKSGRTYLSPRTGAWLEVVDVPPRGSRRDPLVVRRGFPSDRGPGREHVHLDFEERYVVEQGIAEARLDDLRVVLTTEPRRKVLFVPRGTRHLNPWPAERLTSLVLRHEFTPGTEAAQAFVRTLAHVLEEGRDAAGELPDLATLAVLDETDARTWLSRVPVWPQRRVLLPVGARIARRRGYRVKLTR